VTTSGSYAFSVSRNDIVRRALLLIKSLDSRATIDSQTMIDAVQSLNAMIDMWRKQGVHVWKLEEIVLFPQAGQRRYQISLSSPDHIAWGGATYGNYYQTSLTLSANDNATVLNVAAVSNLRVGDAAANIANGDQIGVLLANGQISWGTVTAVGTNTVTMSPGLTGNANAAAQVWNYHSATACVAPRPVGIGRGMGSVRRHDFVGLIDTPIGPCLSRLDYDNLPNKDSPGTITQGYYDQQLTVGYFSLWQVPQTVQHIVKLTAQIPIQYFVNSVDTPDLPNEWALPLIFNLAVVMAPEFSVPAAKLSDLKEMAAMYLGNVASEDREGESLFMQPDLSP
jgi:hypothetical protein